jgi:hypothetical protein
VTFFHLHFADELIFHATALFSTEHNIQQVRYNGIWCGAGSCETTWDYTS